jgi:hypothetical protein
MMSRLSPLVLVLIAVSGLTGCSVDSTDSVICNPAACQYNPNYTPPPSPAPVASSQGPDDWWWNVSPCALLTSSELRGLGFPAGPGYSVMHSVPPAAGSPENDCLWGFGSNSLDITLAAVPYTDWGTTAAGPVPGDIAFRTADGRPGTIFPQLDNAGSCHVAFQATKGSSAVVLVGRRPGTEACKVAVKVASLIAPGLPRRPVRAAGFRRGRSCSIAGGSDRWAR